MLVTNFGLTNLAYKVELHAAKKGEFWTTFPHVINT